MQRSLGARLAWLAVLMIFGTSVTNAADKADKNKSDTDKANVDKAFEVLKTYDFGTDRNLLKPIDDTVVATYGNAEARKELETRLDAVLKSDVHRDAKDYACRVLRVIGTAESVPTLAALLTEKDHSHMARYALQMMPAPEAAQALRDGLPKVSGSLKVGVISSLGGRRDTASVPALAALLGDSDKMISRAAACALGDIGNPESAKALGDFASKAPEGVKSAVVDAELVCAGRLIADGKKAEAKTIYESLVGEDQPKQVRLAATHGILATAGKKD